MAERFVRPDVRALERRAGGTWEERLLGYARAVAVMQERGPEDPTSWIAQATLHGERPRGTWLFLPWLRMYVWFLERIVRAIVVAEGGPGDWALPFWDHGDGDAALPRAFRAPTLPDGTPNALHRPDGERAPGLNAGAALPPAVTSPARALAARTFAPRFGGVPAGPHRAADAPPPALLEAQPHDSVMAALGADAALDPVFPLHLAQVDRLWEVWLRRGGGRANPVHFDWTDQAFAFCDADGGGRDLTCGQVGDLANLDYAYEGLPLPARTERVLRRGADAAPVADWPGRGRAIACVGDEVEIGAAPRRVALRRKAGAAPPERAAAAGSRVYLCLEDAEATPVPGSVWEVRVEGGIGSGRAAAVGTIAFPPRSPNRRFVLDVTDAVGDLAERDLAVTFLPALPPGSQAVAGPAARIGRVFLTDG